MTLTVAPGQIGAVIATVVVIVILALTNLLPSAPPSDACADVALSAPSAFGDKQGVYS
jgi:hypothetical protein